MPDTKQVFDDSKQSMAWFESNCVACAGTESCEMFKNVADSLVSLSLPVGDISSIGETSSGEDWAILNVICNQKS